MSSIRSLCDIFPQLCGNTDPGKCTQAQHRALQDAVNTACKRKRKCTPDQDCNTLASNLQKNTQCQAARYTINFVCYGGGDAGHREAEDSAGKAAKKCAKRMREKGCLLCPRNL
jgi:hypothetical protein